MAATIRDIKDKTGLSLATISKYLNGGNVLPENRKKIEKTIRELKYEVNEIARGLVTNKTKTVGIVVYDVECAFNSALIHHIGKALREMKYGLLICDSANDQSIEEENIKFLVKKKVDGILVIPISKKADFLRPALESKVPVVLIDRPLSDMQLDFIGIDNRLAARLAVERLIAHNHEKIAVISSNYENEHTGFERFKGYVDAMNDASVLVRKEYVKSGRHSVEYGQKSMSELLALEDPPTAVFVTNYDLCIGAIIALNESPYSCPADISIMGFDGLIISKIVRPKICTVIQPLKEIGEKAVEILLSHIDSSKEILPMNILLPTSISDGDSIARLGG